MFGHAQAAQTIDFERPGQTLRIVGMDARGGLRIDLSQLPMQRLPTFGRGPCLQLGTNGRVGARHVGQAFQQRFVIQHGPAHQQRDTPTCGALSHCSQGIGAKFRRRIALGRITNIDQRMGKRVQNDSLGLGRANVHAAIDQCRIDADQVTRQYARQLQGQIGLAGGSRAHQEDCRRKRRHRYGSKHEEGRP